MDQLVQFNPNAASYLKDIDPKLWVTAFYAGPYYGHKTSNVVEATNKVFKEQRELPVLDLLNTIWHYVMEERFERYTQACALYPQIHTPYGYEALVQNQRWAKSNTVQISTTTSGVITQNNHRTFCVDLWLRTCDCGHFQKNGIPCGHAFTLIQALQACINSHPQPRDYMPYFFTTLAWQHTYHYNLKAVSLDQLAAGSNTGEDFGSIVAPKKERKAMGRPKVKRMVAGESRRHIAKAQAVLNNSEIAPVRGAGSQSCTHCGEYGHNRRRCGKL